MIEYDYDVFGKTYIKTGSWDLIDIENYNWELYDNFRLYTWENMIVE